jgi:hypothetical protein
VKIATSTRVRIQKGNRLRTQWQRAHEITLRSLIGYSKEQIDSAIKEQVSNTWQKTLQGLDVKNTSDTWRITKKCNKRKL